MTVPPGSDSRSSVSAVAEGSASFMAPDATITRLTAHSNAREQHVESPSQRTCYHPLLVHRRDSGRVSRTCDAGARGEAARS